MHQQSRGSATSQNSFHITHDILICGFLWLRNMRWKMSFESQQSQDLPKQSVNHIDQPPYQSRQIYYGETGLQRSYLIIWTQPLNTMSSEAIISLQKKIQMRQLAFVQHMQWMSHRCWSADMVKVPGIRGYEGQDVLVESMMSVTPSSSRDTKRQQVLGTSLALIDLSPQWLI